MKQKNLLLTLLIVILAFSSCEKEEEEIILPEIQFDSSEDYISDDTTLAAGENVDIRIIANWNSINLLQTMIISANNQEIQSIEIPEANRELYDFTITITKNADDEVIWSFEVIDNAGGSATISLILNKDNSGLEIIHLEDIELGAQSNSILGSFYSVSENAVYAIEEAASNQEKIDMLCYYDETDKMILASAGANIEGIFSGEFSPDNWITKNETLYFKTELNSTQFTHIDSDKIIISSYDDSAKRKAKDLIAGDIYAFKTQNAKIGLFHVLESGNNSNEGAKLEIKIQK